MTRSRTLVKTRNRGATTLRTRRCRGNPLAEYDSLPPELRRWVSEAALPWGAQSVRTAYQKALARTGDKTRALQELDAIERRLVAKDAGKVWMGTHPATH
ncbi:DUF6525 family protein [Shimia ponticola]|uniref:DUF6525 family protein n=1 Tax=Shimia ponticola TaxID=2582893 RepID=UPI0011BF6BB7|nr:DUF6525 family protein [Shimia ponticola]